MSNSIPEATTCPLEKYCPHQPTDPGTAHPPPEDWMNEAAGKLQQQVAAKGPFTREDGKVLVGIYVSLSGSPVFIWKRDSAGE